MAEQFKYYSVNDFDRYDCVRLSKIFYLSLAFILRGYLVWLMTITNFNDKTSIIAFIYPDISLFYLNLVSGSLGLFILLLMSLRRPNAKSWVKYIWPKTRILLILALTLDVLAISVAYVFWQLADISAVVGQISIAVLCVLLCVKSKRLSLNLKEFPEPLPEK